MYAIRSYYEVLILDEPANGLDPQARIEVREIFRASVAFMQKDETGRMRVSRANHPDDAGDTDVHTDDGTDTVITSYSIHYTKLYEVCLCTSIGPCFFIVSICALVP